MTKVTCVAAQIKNPSRGFVSIGIDPYRISTQGIGVKFLSKIVRFAPICTKNFLPGLAGPEKGPRLRLSIQVVAPNDNSPNAYAYWAVHLGGYREESVTGY